MIFISVNTPLLNLWMVKGMAADLKYIEFYAVKSPRTKDNKIVVENRLAFLFCTAEAIKTYLDNTERRVQFQILCPSFWRRYGGGRSISSGDAYWWNSLPRSWRKCPGTSTGGCLRKLGAAWPHSTNESLIVFRLSKLTGQCFSGPTYFVYQCLVELCGSHHGANINEVASQRNGQPDGA
jgi:hypothetical protein